MFDPPTLIINHGNATTNFPAGNLMESFTQLWFCFPDEFILSQVEKTYQDNSTVNQLYMVSVKGTCLLYLLQFLQYIVYQSTVHGRQRHFKDMSAGFKFI